MYVDSIQISDPIQSVVQHLASLKLEESLEKLTVFEPSQWLRLSLRVIPEIEKHVQQLGNHLKGPQKLRVAQTFFLKIIDAHVNLPDAQKSLAKQWIRDILPHVISAAILVTKEPLEMLQTKLSCLTSCLAHVHQRRL